MLDREIIALLISRVSAVVIVISIAFWLSGFKEAQDICRDHSISISNRTDTMFTIEKINGHTYCCGSEAEGYNPDKPIFFGLMRGANEYSPERCEMVN